MARRYVLVGLLFFLSCCAIAHANGESPTLDTATTLEEPQPLPTIELHDYLVLPSVGHYGRLPVHRDTIEAQIVSGIWQPPTAGEPVSISGEPPKTWRAATAASGVLETRTVRGGYAFTRFHSPVERVMLLDASGHAAVYVNGELHTGDPYRLGWVKLPVLVKEGENTLLFHVAGAQLRAQLSSPPADVYFMDADRTLPTPVQGGSEPVWAAIPIVNATPEWLRDLRIDGGARLEKVAPIPPLSVVKAPFQISPNSAAAGAVPCQVRLLASDNEQPVATAEFSVSVVGHDEVQIHTFRSRVDGSVQPYAIRPARANAAATDSDDNSPPGIIVTLHDAGVSCAEHAAQFEALEWAHIVAPQGRGAYGFDWEDWGRIDAMEALQHARDHFANDAQRTYVTGHAMGGHGTWHLGVTYPDEFAAIAPCAAWPSFWSYGGGMPSFSNPSKLESLILRSYAPSDTLELLSNLSGVGVCVLHHETDNDVPVEQSRFMRARLAGFHTDFAYRESAAHEETQEVFARDWRLASEFFRRQRRPSLAEHVEIDFTTVDPGISSRCDWVRIESQLEPLKPSRVTARQHAATRTIVAQTANVERLAIDVDFLAPNGPIDVALDGQQFSSLPWPDDFTLWFERTDSEWKPAGRPDVKRKGEWRNGRFKSAFDFDALLVYGTGGTDEEDRWAEAKARYDAETFWYRGNGRLEVLPDTQFAADAGDDRSVILYGNADTNSAWSQLLADCPVQVRRGEIQVGERREEGDDLALLMVYPRANTSSATVGVVAGTGPVGMAITNRMRYFISGVAYPDIMVVDSSALLDGVSAVRAWGYFGPSWHVNDGEIAWAAP